MASDGSFAVVWEKAFSATDNDIYLRAFNPDGSPATGDIGVATTSLTEEAPRIATSPDGHHLVVVWQQKDPNNASSHYQINYHYVSPGGTVDGTVSGNSSTDQIQPDVAMAADGSFVVAYTDTFSSTDLDVHVRQFNAFGNPIGSDFGVPGATSSSVEQNPAVAITPDGQRFIVAWETQQTNDVHYTLFNGSGTSVLANQAAASDGVGSKTTGPAVGMAADGSFVIAAQDVASSGNDVGVHVTAYTAGGGLRWQNTLFPTPGNDAAGEPAVAVSADARALVTYTAANSSSFLSDVAFQAYTAAGTADGAGLVSTAAGAQHGSSVAWNGTQAAVSFTSGPSLFTSSSDTILVHRLQVSAAAGSGQGATGASVVRAGNNGKVTGLVVTFGGPLQNPGTYTLTVFGKGKKGRKPRVLTLTPAYVPGSTTVMVSVGLKGNDRSAVLTISGASAADGSPLAPVTFSLNVSPGKKKHG
jgi:hypothetical protein